LIESRLPDYLDHMRTAASDARDFLDGMTKEEFLADKRTTLLRQQAEREFRILAGRADAVATERELKSARRRFIAHAEAFRAVLETARTLQRTPDAVSVRDVTAFGGSH
jgi:hypothetical protein